MSIYDSAKKLIVKYGRDITWRVETNTGTEWDPVYSQVDTVIRAVQTNFDTKDIDGTNIQHGDKMLLIHDSSGMIMQGDKIIDDGEEWTIVSIEEIRPGSTRYIYKAQIRR